MAILNFCGWESGIPSELQSNTGTNSISSAQARTGTYSWKVNPTGSGTGNGYIRKIGSSGLRNQLLNVDTLYTTFYFRVETLPATEEQFFVIRDTGDSDKAYLTVTSSGYIKAYNNAGSLGGTGTTALSTNTWYRIDVKSSTGSGNQPFQVKINGTLELDLSINQLTNQHGTVRVGKVVNINSDSVVYYFDDVVLCDDDFVTSGYEIKKLQVDSDGSTQDWTSGSSPSNYTCIDEIPVSYSDYIQCGTGSGDKVALFGFKSTATAGISGTILGVITLAMVKEPTSGTSSNKHRIKSGSSTLNSASGYDATTSNVSTGILALTDPATSAAWTTSGLDSVEAGLVEANAIAVTCSNYMMSVLYVPPTGTAAQTLDEANQAAAGTVGSSGTTGTSAQLADETTQAASGTITNAGTSAQTADESQQTASGALTVTGTAAQANDEASQASAGLVSNQGAAAQTLDETSQVAAGEQTNRGAGVQVLDETTQAVSGALTNTGALAQTLDEASQEAAGEVESAGLSGSIAQAIDEAQQSASGALTNIGALAQTLDEATQTASGSLLYTGGVAQDLDESLQAAAGTLTNTGASAQTLDEANQVIIGTIANIGAIVQVSDRVSQTLNDVIIYPLVEVSLTRVFQTTIDRQYAIELERSFNHAVY